VSEHAIVYGYILLERMRNLSCWEPGSRHTS